MKRLILAALAALCLAPAALAATLLATPATLPTILAKTAQSGDTVAMSAGSYGDVIVPARVFAPALALTNADPANPATLRSLKIQGVTGLHASGFNVTFTPDAQTVAWSQAVTVDASADVILDRLKIVGGPAANGVSEDAPALDATDNVIGRPTARGVAIANSHDIALTNSEISTFDRGLALAPSQHILIQGNYIHHLRHSGAVGGSPDLTFDRNVISDLNPWRVGQTPVGDHSDLLALWSSGGQTTPSARVRITNNIMLQATGAPSLGMWLQGNAPTAAIPAGAPFTDFTISGNFIGVGNNQGIALWQAQGGTISGNTLVQVPFVGMTPEQLAKQLPTVMLLGGSTGNTTTNNALGVAMADASVAGKPSPTNTTSGNSLTKPSSDGGATEIKAWLVNHPDMAALSAPLLPPPPVDTRDAQIAALIAKVADLQAGQAASDAKILDLTGRLSAANDNLKILNASLAAAADTIAKVRAAVAP